MTEKPSSQYVKSTFELELGAIYSYSIEPLYVLHSRFPTKKSWVVAYLKFKTTVQMFSP